MNQAVLCELQPVQPRQSATAQRHPLFIRLAFLRIRGKVLTTPGSRTACFPALVRLIRLPWRIIPGSVHPNTKKLPHSECSAVCGRRSLPEMPAVFSVLRGKQPVAHMHGTGQREMQIIAVALPVHIEKFPEDMDAGMLPAFQIVT